MSIGKAVLIVLDGFGIGQDSPFNAIENAKMPFYRELLQKYPTAELVTHGEAVGLPTGVMGNSEVGHMTMGAGRIIYQDLTRISNSIQSGEFFKNQVLKNTIQMGAHTTGRVHLMGLLSEGGVHSHLDHLLALMDQCMSEKVPHVFLHLFLDGRDSAPDSSLEYLKKLQLHQSFSQSKVKGSTTQVCIGSIMGRYWAMDRDQRWERVQKAYQTLTGQVAAVTVTPEEVILKSHASGCWDEFIEPILFSSDASMQNGDSVIFFNFRADRAREISRALTELNFSAFSRGHEFQPSSFAGMTIYDRSLTQVTPAFLQQNLDHIFGAWLEEKNLKQFRIAETEKYAHVTFFFNGGREQPYRNEDRLLVPSPRDVATYDLKPEMSADTVALRAAENIEKGFYDFVLMNFANADMVGHTGNYEAAVLAAESLDRCLSQVVGAAEKNGYSVLITADHGNAEEMRDCRGHRHTQHTLNPVPVIWVAPNTAIAPRSSRGRLRNGSLTDIMPTLCELMSLEIPAEVTGRSLIL